jgi:hypothetical protein
MLMYSARGGHPDDDRLCRPNFELRYRNSYPIVVLEPRWPHCRLIQFVTGARLMYCTYALTVELALGANVWA